MITIKRILCILSNMNTGGAETFLMKIYRALDKDKYQMDFCLSIKGKSYYEDEIISLGGQIFHITPKTDSYIRFKEDLQKVISENQYKYVLRITANALGLMDLKIAKKSGAETCIARSSNSNDDGSIKSKLAHKVGQQLFLKYVDKKIAPSDLAAIYTFGNKAYKNGEVAILHNALDLGYYQYSESARRSIRKEFGIPSDSLVVGNIGRFMVQKNHQKIIEIFQEIIKIKPNSYLVLVGNGELELEIREKVEHLSLNKNVIFAGIRSDIPAVLSSMDVLLMPSLYEGMPNAVIEAQANGLKCVISDSITKEADITGLVEYISLQKPADYWAKQILENKQPHQDTTEHFIKAGYDIQSATEKFVKIIGLE